MIEIAPGPEPPDAEIKVPGSKYEANRLLLAAALAEGESRIRGAPQNEDIEAAITALSAIGAGISGAPGALRVRGLGRGAARPASGPLEVSVGESGTLLRFLTAAAATVPIPVRITGGGRIHERPISGLVAALRALGAEIETTGGRAPLVIRSGALEGGRVRVSARESSQFASALLLAAPRARGTVVIELADEPVSRSYLDLTVSVMARCGVRVEAAGDRRFRIGAGERYPGGDHRRVRRLDHRRLLFRRRGRRSRKGSGLRARPPLPAGRAAFPGAAGRDGVRSERGRIRRPRPGERPRPPPASRDRGGHGFDAGRGADAGRHRALRRRPDPPHGNRPSAAQGERPAGRDGRRTLRTRRPGRKRIRTPSLSSLRRSGPGPSIRAATTGSRWRFP